MSSVREALVVLVLVLVLVVLVVVGSLSMVVAAMVPVAVVVSAMVGLFMESGWERVSAPVFVFGRHTAFRRISRTKRAKFWRGSVPYLPNGVNPLFSNKLLFNRLRYDTRKQTFVRYDTIRYI